jgi:hypothetical protein
MATPASASGRGEEQRLPAGAPDGAGQGAASAADYFGLPPERTVEIGYVVPI